MSAVHAVLERVVVLAHQGHDFATSTTEHHASPTGGFYETLVVVVGWAIVLVVTVLTVKLLVRPGEKRADHIKRLILEDERVVTP